MRTKYFVQATAYLSWMVEADNEYEAEQAVMSNPKKGMEIDWEIHPVITELETEPFYSLPKQAYKVVRVKTL